MIAGCPALHFKQPVDEYSKTASFHSLLAAGENIVATHALFSRQELTPIVLEQIQGFGYTLILDEVLEVIAPLSDTKITKTEVSMLFAQSWVEADQDGRVHWLLGDTPVSRFKDIRALARSHALIWYDGVMFLWEFPSAMLRAFAETYVLTFLFEGSNLMHYLNVYGIPFSYHHVQDGVLFDGLPDMTTAKARIAPLIEVYEGPLNDIGRADTALSKKWYKKNRGWKKERKRCNSQEGQGQREAPKAQVVFLNARNILMNRYKASCDTAMWCCYKDERKRYSLQSYASSFCQCNARATNEHRLRTHLAYLVNIFVHPYVDRWFKSHGVTLNQDAFALSLLLQWIWRSAIRDGVPVRLYLPSHRMRSLLYRWLGKPTA